MYKCKCGNKLDLTSEQWEDKRLHSESTHSVKCDKCGETLNVVSYCDYDGTWYVCDLYFDSSNKYRLINLDLTQDVNNPDVAWYGNSVGEMKKYQEDNYYFFFEGQEFVNGEWVMILNPNGSMIN